jgi:hypothetical protein
MMQSAYSRAVRSASYYEMKAEEVRTIADETRDPWTQKVLFGVADDYIRMAGDRLSLEQSRRMLGSKRV